MPASLTQPYPDLSFFMVCGFEKRVVSFDLGGKTQPALRGFHKDLSQIGIGCVRGNRQAALRRSRGFSRGCYGSCAIPRTLESIPKLEVLVKAESDLAALLTWRRWNDGPTISFVFKQPHREASAGHWGEAKGGEKMATISISKRTFGSTQQPNARQIYWRSSCSAFSRSFWLA